MYCRKCGAKLSDTAEICLYCSTLVNPPEKKPPEKKAVAGKGYRIFFVVARVFFIIMAALFALLSLLDVTLLVGAAICLIIGIVCKPERMVAITLKEKEMRQQREKTRRWPYDEPEDAWLTDKGEDIKKYAPAPDSQYGFANMPKFVVRGVRAETKRKNTITVSCADEAAARKYALEISGLIEPLEISPNEFRPACELSYGLTVPEGATRDDALAFENSVLARDAKHIPPAFMDYLVRNGIAISWLSGRDTAARAVLSRCDLREKSVFYAYAVNCHLRGELPGDIDDDPQIELYEKFADAVAYEPKVLESISHRPERDMWEPSTRTAAYAYTVKFLRHK